MDAILIGSSQSGWQTTTSTANDPSSFSLHSTSREPHNSSLPSLRILCPTRTDTESLATSRCPALPAWQRTSNFRKSCLALGFNLVSSQALLYGSPEAAL